MARKPEPGMGQGGEDAETSRAAQGAEAEVQRAADAAKGIGPALVAAQRGGERSAVLSAGPIPEIKLGPVQAPNPRGTPDDFPGVPRDLMDPDQVAPVVADATTRGRAGADAGTPKPRQHYIVMEAKQVVDKTSGARTRIPAGKVIHDGHYDIAHLLRQGVRLKKTDAPGTAAGDEALIAALTE